MTNDPVIQVNNLTKTYKLYNKPIDRLKETFNPFKKKYHHNFNALKNISFSVGRGEILGIVGKNGSGKSTILQIITGVLTPTSGSCSVHGKISAILELGAGFNPDLTGLENVYFKSSLLGFPKEEVDKNLDRILAFAGIGDFIYQPVKTYSSGMFVRLAFAVAINVDPDILIVDEALSVGDFRFQQKCMRQFDDFLQANKTILFVSHDHGTIIQYCTKAIWLQDGKIKELGSPQDVCQNYIADMSYGDIGPNHKTAEKPQKHKITIPVNKTRYDNIQWVGVSECNSFGEGHAEIIAVSLISKKYLAKIDVFEGGRRVIFLVKLRTHQEIRNPIVGFHLNNSRGVSLLGLNSYVAGVDIGTLPANREFIVEFEFNFPYLLTGPYSLTPAIAEGTQDDHIQHHWVHDAYFFRIAGDKKFTVLGDQFIIKDNFNIRVI